MTKPIVTATVGSEGFRMLIGLLLLTLQASPQEILASREVARYVYLRTGKLPPAGAIVVARKDHSRFGKDLKPQEYLLRTVGKKLYIVGGDDAGTLYGAYRFAEKLGVRFYLHGDTIPDKRISFRLPRLNERGRPLFSLRGIQPFHDFPEGPDWWSRDDYLATIAQLPKMGMNFIGFHAYPEGGAGPEPLVWIGLKQDLNPDGTVKFSYPAQWANTQRPVAWGYAATKTSEFSGGASQLFAGDDYGTPLPKTPEESNAVFNATGAILRDAFALARTLGVKTCVGTETPLTIPAKVKDRLRQLDKDPSDVKPLYEGMLERIRRAFPTDYFWLWTPEDWTWSGNTPGQFQRTVSDIRAAIAAVPDKMGFATSGWVLGPQNDRSALDRTLPKSVAVSAINQQVGHAAVEPGFGKIRGRSKWAIPWMENDPGLTAPQLWAGRMRYDAADALRLGCDGLMGIHWRTKVLAPTVSALAAAGWDQSWKPSSFGKAAGTERVQDGNTALFSYPVSDTEEDAVYQSVRYGLSGYDMKVPNGAYTVTLMFNEPYYDAPGKRVFGVKVQGRRVIDNLDIFDTVGKNRALDYRFNDIRVDGEKLQIEFETVTEFPAIAGIVVDNGRYRRAINCGGPRYKDYESDQTDSGAKARARSMPVDAFYADFALTNFGLAEVGRIFASIDGTKLPEPATWIDGPGGIQIQAVPARQYAFVDQFERLQSKIIGTGNRERFGYWLNTFRYMRAMAEVGALRTRLDKEVSEPTKALETRIELTKAWDRMFGYLMQTVGSPGEMGTVANMEQHVLRQQMLLSLHDDVLAKALGRPLPSSTMPKKGYSGPPRIIVPTTRSLAHAGERLQIRAILLGSRGGTLYWREMGKGSYWQTPLKREGRSVYQVVLPIPPRSTAVEYYISTNDGQRFPATAPSINQTIVVAP